MQQTDFVYSNNLF